MAKGYKAPIRQSNLEITKRDLMKTKDLLFNLTDAKGNLILDGTRKTAILGFSVTIYSVLNIAAKFIAPPDAPLKYVSQ